MTKVRPIIKDLKIFLDERGSLFEILRSDDPCYSCFGQLYVSTVNPYTVKGFHRHFRKTDYITCVSGQVRFVVVETDDNNNMIDFYEVYLGERSPKLLIVPPTLWHGWKCVGNKEAVLVNITTEPFYERDKDEVRVDPIDNPWGYKWEIKHG